MIASDSMKIFSAGGTREPRTAIQPTTNAMSVAIGTAQPARPGKLGWSRR